MRIISIVIPVVSVVLVAGDGLFPTWMKIEQAISAAVLIAVAVLAHSRRVRGAFPAEA